VGRLADRDRAIGLQVVEPADLEIVQLQVGEALRIPGDLAQPGDVRARTAAAVIAPTLRIATDSGSSAGGGTNFGIEGVGFEPSGWVCGVR
jgi:hypothetical protein